MQHASSGEWRRLVLLAIGLLLLAAAATEAAIDSRRAEDLNDRAIAVRPRVEAVRNESGRTLAAFTFEAEGRQIQSELRVVAQTEVGDRLEVRYEPGDPSRHWLEGRDPPGTETWILGPAVVPALACLWVWHRGRPRGPLAEVP